MPYTAPDMFRLITPDEWRDELGDIANWSFERVEKQIPSPTCLFSVEIRLRLPGFEKVKEVYHVDEADIRQNPFSKLSDPEDAYVKYMRAQFRINVLEKAVKAIKTHRAMIAANLASRVLTIRERDQQRIDGIEDPFLKRRAVDMANMKHDMRAKGFIGKGAKYSHLDYFKKL